MSRASLEGRRVLLTGATGGLGRSLATAFVEAGCRLVISSRSPGPLSELRRQLDPEGGLVRDVPADLSDPDATGALASEAEAAFGGVDVLVNNAGLFLHRPLAESTLEEFDRLVQVNLRAPFLLTRALVSGMTRRGWGRIVNVGSSSSYEGFAGSALYCASKHGLLGFSRALLAEYREQGVRVICVSPGSIQTPMGRQVPGHETDYERYLEPDDVASMVLHVLGYAGALVTDEIRLNRIGRS